MEFLFIALLSLLPSLEIPSTETIHSKVFPDKFIEGAKECTQYMAKTEKLYNFPNYILPAISMTETGRWNKKYSMNLPWPWTINVEGKSYYFNSKNEAIEEVAKLQAQGKELIDIGCMQVNLYFHKDAFKNLEEAFDPKANIEYAAKFLKNNYKKTDDWDRAVQIYHSYNPDLGEIYLNRVYTNWDDLQEKILYSGKGSKVYKKYTAIFGERENKKRVFKKRNTGDMMVYQAKPQPKTTVTITKPNKVQIF